MLWVHLGLSLFLALQADMARARGDYPSFRLRALLSLLNLVAGIITFVGVMFS